MDKVVIIRSPAGPKISYWLGIEIFQKGSFLRGILYTTLYDRIGNIGVLRMGKDTKLSFPLAAAFRQSFVTKRPRGAFFAIVRFDERNCPV